MNRSQLVENLGGQNIELPLGQIERVHACLGAFCEDSEDVDIGLMARVIGKDIGDRIPGPCWPYADRVFCTHVCK